MKTRLFFLFSLASITLGIAQNKVGVNITTPGSMLSVKGNVSIGANYASTAAPANGLLVEGNVGIGTVAPTAGLHLINNDGLVAQGTLGSGNNLVVAGAGTRMIWSAQKGAFRAGNVGGTQWDDANVGVMSIAFGQNNIASDSAAMAIGKANTASGKFTFVSGTQNIASGVLLRLWVY